MSVLKGGRCPVSPGQVGEWGTATPGHTWKVLEIEVSGQNNGWHRSTGDDPLANCLGSGSVTCLDLCGGVWERGLEQSCGVGSNGGFYTLGLSIGVRLLGHIEIGDCELRDRVREGGSLGAALVFNGGECGQGLGHGIRSIGMFRGQFRIVEWESSHDVKPTNCSPSELGQGDNFPFVQDSEGFVKGGAFWCWAFGIGPRLKGKCRDIVRTCVRPS
ncbi:hypothetical protein Tco_0689392 [Tanacetum coccineum]